MLQSAPDLGIPNTPMRHSLSFALVAGSLLLTACGSSDSSSTTENASPATARKQVAETKTALKTALATYKSGDKKAANEQVAEAYVSHFEDVEGPLEGKDDELKESLEHAIADDLRTSMKAGKPASEVEAQVKAILAKLDQAEAALQ
jgi:major membrane immunogen (membrane-anchored lipoprotein)